MQTNRQWAMTKQLLEGEQVKQLLEGEQVKVKFWNSQLQPDHTIDLITIDGVSFCLMSTVS